MKKKLLLLLCSLWNFGGNLSYALTPADILETALYEEDEEKPKIPWHQRHAVAIGAIFSETNILKNYASYLPGTHNGTSIATLQLINELFTWQNGDFVPATSFGKVGKFLSLKDAGIIAGLLSFNSSEEHLRKNLETLCTKCSSNESRERFGKSSSKMKDFVDIIVRAQNESRKIEHRKVQLFERHTPLFIFYAFVYKKAQSRTDLLDFFNGFLLPKTRLEDVEPFDEKGCSVSAERSVLEDTVSSAMKNVENLPEEIKWINVVASQKRLKEYRDFSAYNLDIEEFVAVILTQNWTSFDIPQRMITQVKVPHTKIASFYKDCVEDVLYKCAFLIKKYCRQQLDEKKINEKVYAKLFSCLEDTKNFSSQADHATWNHTMIGGNVPYMIYRKVISSSGVSLLDETDCAICLPADSPLIPQDAPQNGLFYLIDPEIEMLAFRADGDCVGCALSSHMSNIVVGLDKLFACGLPFFAKNISDFWDGSFYYAYLMQLGECLGISFSYDKNQSFEHAKVFFTLGDSAYELFCTNLQHVGIASCLNVLPLNIKKEKLSGQDSVFGLLQGTVQSGRLRRYCYPAVLFTGSWSDFDSKEKARKRFLLVEQRSSNHNFDLITNKIKRQLDT